MKRCALGLLSLLAWLPAAAAGTDTEQVRTALNEGNTVKAVRLAEQALEDSAGNDGAELRYLLLKAYVVDLQPENGKLFKQVAGKEPDGMELYQRHIEALEDAVRAQGEPTLALSARLLEDGDDLDRLLVLGLLEDVIGEAAWEAAPAATRGAVQEAAGRAVQQAVDDCATSESFGGRIDPQPDAYLQSLYALLSGLSFLSHADPPRAAQAAAAGLTCRSAAGRILQDRQQLERIGPDLAGPLHDTLAGTLREDVQVDALILLGRYGRCEDLDIVRDHGVRGEGEVAATATNALRRMQRRLDCAG